MTREPDVVAFSIDETDEEILKTIRESGLSRYPVYDEDINDIVGILNARDYLLDRRSDSPEGLKGLLRKPYFVPDTIHADDLFRDMQKGKVHIAIVIDEYGQTAGVITMEDLLEEIVGNIYDEFVLRSLRKSYSWKRISGGYRAALISKISRRRWISSCRRIWIMIRWAV